MKALITNVEQAFTSNGAEYKKVTVLDGSSKTTTKNVFDNLEDKWGLLVENKFLEFVMEKKGQFWNVIDIKEAELPPAKEPTMLPEQQAEIDEALRGKPAPQELGMWWKELGEAIRAGNIDVDFPNNAVKIRSQYYKRMSEITGVAFK